MKQRILSLLVLLMTAVTGVWATDYTTLAVGDVIKVGDTFSPTAESEGAFNNNGVENGETCTLIRADVDNDYNVTEKTDGAYYVFKSDSGWNPYIHFEKAFAVTAISDGLEVTNIENIKGKLMYTLALHESAAPVAVTGVILSPTSASLTVGDAVTLTATVAPDDATDKKVKWTVTAGTENVKLYKDADCNTEVGTEATDVLTVYAKGIAAGEATVKVESNADATKSATCTVTAATGAGAQEEVLLTTINASSDFISGSKTFDGVATVTITGDIAYDDPDMGWSAEYSSSGGSVSVEPAEGTTISSCKFYFDDNQTYTISTAPFVLYPTTHLSDYTIYTGPNSTGEELYGSGGIKKIEVYGVAVPVYGVALKSGTEDAANWQGKAGTDDYQELPLTGVEAGTTVTVKYFGTKKVESVKAVKKASATPLDNTTTAWSAGIFAVPAGGLTYSDAITVSGDVTLVLTDGETLTLNKGISIAEGATLTVEGNGTMAVNGTNNSTASTVAGTGMLVLTSGTLTAKGGNGQSIDSQDRVTGNTGGAAINGSVTVNGGSLTATGGNGGSVTGNSKKSTGGAGGTAITGALNINGGTVVTTNGSAGTSESPFATAPNTAGSGGKAVAGTVTDNR